MFDKELIGARIVNIRRGEPENGRNDYIYAQVLSSTGGLLINATLDYICEAFADCLPVEATEYQLDPVAEAWTAYDNMMTERNTAQAKLEAVRKTAAALYATPFGRLLGLQLYNDLGETPPDV